MAAAKPNLNVQRKKSFQVSIKDFDFRFTETCCVALHC